MKKYGWPYKGGRNWRTRVIYDTNMSTSYAAGQWQQLQDVKQYRPYWRYRHSHASVEPRELHLAWDGLVLEADDPWWHTHYPPNGWGCKCYVESLTRTQAKKAGIGKAPRIEWQKVNVGVRGPSPRLSEPTPKGINPGFAYAPGRTVADRKARLIREMGEDRYEKLRAESRRRALASGVLGKKMLDTAERVVVYRSTEMAKASSERLRKDPIKALDVDDKKSLIGFASTYNAALEKLPDYKRQVRRRVDLKGQALEDFLQQHQKNKTVIYNGFTHATADASFLPTFPGNVEIVIQSRHGKRIRDWSAHPVENEVAFKLGTAFRVDDVYSRNGKHIIKLIELD